MSKYIDADLLRKDIDNWKKAMADAVGEYSDGVRFALKHFTFVLESLQHEQQEVDLEADIEMEWDSFNKHLDEYGEESEDVVWLNWNSFKDVACYFYELGLKAGKEEKK